MKFSDLLYTGIIIGMLGVLVWSTSEYLNTLAVIESLEKG